MRVIQTNIPDTTSQNRYRSPGMRKNLEYNLKQPTKKCLNVGDLDTLVSIWGEVKWKVGEANALGPVIIDFVETLQNHKYYERYYKPFMAMLREHTMSDVVTITQGQCTRLCSAVPLPLKAAKVINDIPYSYFFNDFDIRRKVCHNFMWSPFSISMYKLVQDNPQKEWNSLNTLLHNTRDKFYDHAFKNKRITGNVIGGVNDLDMRREEDGSDMLEFYKDLYNYADGKGGAILQRMAIQSWVWHPSIRHEDMIMHPFRWDTMPDAILPIDSMVEKPKKSSLQTMMERDIL